MKIFRIIKDSKLDSYLNYRPALFAYKGKIYKVESWKDLFKLVMYKNGTVENKIQHLYKEINTRNKDFNNRIIFSDKRIEYNTSIKFSSNYYLNYSSNSYENARLLLKFRDYFGFIAYLVEYSDESKVDIDKLISKERKILKSKKFYNEGSLSHLIAYINGEVLNDEEKFFLRVNKQFGKIRFISDIDVKENEEYYLKDYMQKALKRVVKNRSIDNERIFALGLVRAAMKHYENGEFWPSLEKEYGIKVTGNQQRFVNDKYIEILKANNLFLDNNNTDKIQNINMHCFVTDKYADSLFSFFYSFWNTDLSRNIDYLKNEEGSKLFENLIYNMVNNIDNRFPEVMVHTSMAIEYNPIGAKRRIKRIIEVIDGSYFANKEIEKRNSRMDSLLFTWIKKNINNEEDCREEKSSYSKKLITKDKRIRSPFIQLDQKNYSINIVLPGQYLREIDINNLPKWFIKIGEKEKIIDAEVIERKLSFIVSQSEEALDHSDIFKRIQITFTNGEVKRHWTLKDDGVLFFDDKGKMVEDPENEILPMTIRHIITDENDNIGSLPRELIENNDYCINNMKIISIEPKEGEMLIFPNGIFKSFGTDIKEGIISQKRYKTVYADDGYEKYHVTSENEAIYQKIDKKSFSGVRIIIYKNEGEIFKKRLSSCKYEKYKHGYLIRLFDYIKGDGLYRIEIDIPGKFNTRVYKICYIENLTYRFDKSYFFKDKIRIYFDEGVKIHDRYKWYKEYKESEKYLVVDLSKVSDLKEFIQGQFLVLDYKMDGFIIKLKFIMPVLLWKTTNEGKWHHEKPEKVFVNNLPDKLFVADSFLGESPRLLIKGGQHREESIHGEFDKENNCYQFDLYSLKYMNDFNDDKDDNIEKKISKKIYIAFNGPLNNFVDIIYKSYVEDYSITGDFINNLIYGKLKIFGDNEYFITVKKKNEVITENYKIDHGEFKISDELTEDLYKFEIKEKKEDFFGSELVRFKTIDSKFFDLRKLEGKIIKIKSIHDIEEKFDKLSLNDGHYISNLKKINLKEIYDYDDIYSFKYEVDYLLNCISYEGILTNIDERNRYCNRGHVIIIFVNAKNIYEPLILKVDNNGPEAMYFDEETGMLNSSGSSCEPYVQKKCKIIDDDRYKIKVEIGEDNGI